MYGSRDKSRENNRELRVPWTCATLRKWRRRSGLRREKTEQNLPLVRMDVTTTCVPGVRCVLTLNQSILVISDVASKETILFCDSLRIVFQTKVTLVIDANRQSKFQPFLLNHYCSPSSTQGRPNACSFEERFGVERVTTHLQSQARLVTDEVALPAQANASNKIMCCFVQRSILTFPS